MIDHVIPLSFWPFGSRNTTKIFWLYYSLYLCSYNNEWLQKSFLHEIFWNYLFYNAEHMRYHLSKKVIRWEEIAYYLVHCVSRKCHVQNVSGFVINIYTDAAKGSRNCCICKVYLEYITMEMRLERGKHMRSGNLCTLLH